MPAAAAVHSTLMDQMTALARLLLPPALVALDWLRPLAWLATLAWLGVPPAPAAPANADSRKQLQLRHDSFSAASARAAHARPNR